MSEDQPKEHLTSPQDMGSAERRGETDEECVARLCATGLFQDTGEPAGQLMARLRRKFGSPFVDKEGYEAMGLKARLEYCNRDEYDRIKPLFWAGDPKKESMFLASLPLLTEIAEEICTEIEEEGATPSDLIFVRSLPQFPWIYCHLYYEEGLTFWDPMHWTTCRCVCSGRHSREWRKLYGLEGVPGFDDKGHTEKSLNEHVDVMIGDQHGSTEHKLVRRFQNGIVKSKTLKGVLVDAGRLQPGDEPWQPFEEERIENARIEKERTEKWLVKKNRREKEKEHFSAEEDNQHKKEEIQSGIQSEDDSNDKKRAAREDNSMDNTKKPRAL